MSPLRTPLEYGTINCSRKPPRISTACVFALNLMSVNDIIIPRVHNIICMDVFVCVCVYTCVNITVGTRYYKRLRHVYFTEIVPVDWPPENR